MIGIRELEKRLKFMIEKFQNRTKFILCCIIDDDGFILAENYSDLLVKHESEKSILQFFGSYSNLKKWDNLWSQNGDSAVNVITFREMESYFNLGFMTIFGEISPFLTLLAVYPTVLRDKHIIKEFELLLKEISKYFVDLRETKGFEKFCKLIK